MGRLDGLSLSVPVEEIVSEDGASHLRVVFSPPLGSGLKTIPIPRTRLEFLVAKRHLGELSAARELARGVLRAAMKALDAFEDCDTQVYLSDAEVLTGHDLFRDDEVEGLARVLESVAMAVSRELGHRPQAPWKQAVLEAWAPLVGELGATFDREELRLTARRGELTARASVLLDDDENWLTRIEIRLDAQAAARASEIDLDASFEGDGTRAGVVGSELWVTRSGLVADAGYLSRLIGMAFDLAADLGRRFGPYRT